LDGIILKPLCNPEMDQGSSTFLILYLAGLPLKGYGIVFPLARFSIGKIEIAYPNLNLDLPLGEDGWRI